MNDGHLRLLVTPARLARYAVAGGTSAATHLGVLTLLVELAQLRPIVASTIGFLASIAVSYLLQRRWVFASASPVARTLPRFLVVVGVGLALNTTILAVGTEWFAHHYLLVQLVALVAIPVSNYLLNSLWTFR